MKHIIIVILLHLNPLHYMQSDAQVLDSLRYHGPHRAVYLVGSDHCYTDDDRKPFPQEDLKCR